MKKPSNQKCTFEEQCNTALRIARTLAEMWGYPYANALSSIKHFDKLITVHGIYNGKFVLHSFPSHYMEMDEEEIITNETKAIDKHRADIANITPLYKKLPRRRGLYIALNTDFKNKMVSNERNSSK